MKIGWPTTRDGLAATSAAVAGRVVRAGAIPIGFAGGYRPAHALAEAGAVCVIDDLADDGIVFRPGPVNGKEVWSKRTENGLDLIWEPTFTAVASSADFGYDTGPSKWRAKKTDEQRIGRP